MDFKPMLISSMLSPSGDRFISSGTGSNPSGDGPNPLKEGSNPALAYAYIVDEDEIWDTVALPLAQIKERLQEYLSTMHRERGLVAPFSLPRDNHGGFPSVKDAFESTTLPSMTILTSDGEPPHCFSTEPVERHPISQSWDIIQGPVKFNFNITSVRSAESSNKEREDGREFFLYYVAPEGDESEWVIQDLELCDTSLSNSEDASETSTDGGLALRRAHEDKETDTLIGAALRMGSWRALLSDFDQVHCADVEFELSALPSVQMTPEWRARLGHAGQAAGSAE